MKSPRIACAAVAVAAAAFPPHAAWAADGAIICGGVGSDARRALASSVQDANLSLQFSLLGRGNYVAGVDVTLTPANGGAPVTARTDGPICYAKLAPGRYRVAATYEGTTKTATATVSSQGKPARIAMAFPPSAADIDPAPVSPEEKLQASKP